MSNEDQIAALYCMIAAYYGRQIIDPVARMYAQDLSDLDPSEVKDALKAMRADPKRRTIPLPAEVRCYLDRGNAGPTAEQVAARIYGAISKFGHNNSARAREHIGEAGWQAVDDMGGWSSLCRNQRADAQGTFVAQTRELVRVYLDRPQFIPQDRHLAPGSPQRRLQGLTETIGAW